MMPLIGSQSTRVPLVTYDVTQISEGPALLLVGMFAMLLTAAVVLRNPAAIGSWGLTVLLFVFSGLFGLGFEWVWLAVISTVVLLVIGAVLRWST